MIQHQRMIGRNQRKVVAKITRNGRATQWNIEARKPQGL